MTPVWVFPAYPLLITAPFAGNLINSSVKVGHTSTLNALPIAMAAVAVQGMGFCLSFMILAAFIYRLMTQKLPRDMQRPGVFISIGPSAFTAAGLGKSQRHHAHPLSRIPATKLTCLLRSPTWRAGGRDSSG